MKTVKDFENYFQAISIAENFGKEQLIARITDIIEELGMVTLVNIDNRYNINEYIHFIIKRFDLYYSRNSDVTKNKVLLYAIDFDNYEHVIELSKLDSKHLLLIYDFLLIINKYLQ